MADNERDRLAAAHRGDEPWRRWGSYVSDRQWGTVREDYGATGDSWTYFPHDHARSRAYRWSEDGIAGICDDQQRLCLSLALWNGVDPILKERYFGLTNEEGNHGEDVKELYYYLDATPTHSYMKMLYKYPQAAFPYSRLLDENRRRGRESPEFELIETGIFDDNRYFDVVVEYAKVDVNDILMLVTVTNRGPSQATLHVLPHLWFRNTWSWTANSTKPSLKAIDNNVVEAQHARLGRYHLYCDGQPQLLFCENETNVRRLFGTNDAAGPFKDGVNDYLVNGNADAVSQNATGTKAAAHYQVDVPAGGTVALRLRLSDAEPAKPFDSFDAVIAARRQEADDFYEPLQREIPDADARLVQRQAWAGMIWSQQFYHYDVWRWLEGDPAQPLPPPERQHLRNDRWRHLNNADIISMPDKWEFPWYAAWDLAFHCIPLAVIDAEFAKGQLVLLARVVHAPERAVAGLRMEFQRRESAGARLGRVASVSDRSQTAWRRRRH